MTDEPPKQVTFILMCLKTAAPWRIKNDTIKSE